MQAISRVQQVCIYVVCQETRFYLRRPRRIRRKCPDFQGLRRLGSGWAPAAFLRAAETAERGLDGIF